MLIEYSVQKKAGGKKQPSSLKKAIKQLNFIDEFISNAEFENAIKHNIVSKKNPLLIQLKVEGKYLEILNTFQPRKEKVPSTGIGLKNLKDRYQLLSNLEPYFGVEGNQYLARIPII